MPGLSDFHRIWWLPFTSGLTNLEPWADMKPEPGSALPIFNNFMREALANQPTFRSVFLPASSWCESIMKTASRLSRRISP